MNNKLYFRQTDEIHDSGYKIIEVGYIDEFFERKQIGMCSDVINFGFCNMYEMPKELNIEIDKDGYINFWSNFEELEWRRPILSNALVVVKGNKR